MKATTESNTVKDTVQQKYGEAARRVSSASPGSCCSASSAFSDCDPITKDLYATDQTATLPETAVLASLGCGNPTALAELKLGETVLDLGSGGGIDVLLSARRVGPTGKAFGLDMTDDMLALARENQLKAGATNVEFFKGEIESIPLPDNTVDVIISNCVINLSADKDRVLREAFRVLKHGGRFAVSDVVVRGEVPPDIRNNMELWVGCVAGALEETEYRDKLFAAGFANIELVPTRVYAAEDARAFLQGSGLNFEDFAASIDGKFASMFVRAQKPAVSSDSAPKLLEVFDPAMCCSTGVCGPSPDPFLPRFSADLDWLSTQGVLVKRYNLAQDPAAFAANEIVKSALTTDGTDCLPLILVNGSLVSKGKFPVRYSLARWVGLPTASSTLELPVITQSECC